MGAYDLPDMPVAPAAAKLPVNAQPKQYDLPDMPAAPAVAEPRPADSASAYDLPDMPTTPALNGRTTYNIQGPEKGMLDRASPGGSFDSLSPAEQDRVFQQYFKGVPVTEVSTDGPVPTAPVVAPPPARKPGGAGAPAPYVPGSTVVAPGMSRDPLAGPVDTANSVMGWLGRQAAGLANTTIGRPIKDTYNLGFNILDYLVAEHQHNVQGTARPEHNPFVDMGTGLWNTVKEHPQDVLFESPRFVREHGLANLVTTGEGWGTMVNDTVGTAAVLPVISKITRLARMGVPAKALSAIDRATALVVPKYMWTDETFALEGAREGRIMAGIPGLAPADVRRISNDLFLNDLSTAKAFDGQPLVINAPGTPTMPKGYTKLADSGEFSPKWKDTWVHPDVVDIAPMLQEPRVLAQSLRELMTLRGYMQTWKGTHTILSPNTHASNVLGDFLFAHLNGNNPANPANLPFYKKATELIIDYERSGTLSPELRSIMESGEVRPGMIKNELSNHPIFDQPGIKQVGQFYDWQDQWFRISTALHNRANGMTPLQSSIQLNKTFPSYSSTSWAGRELRGQGSMVGAAAGGPFTSFGMETMRIYMQAAKDHPYRMMTAGAMPKAVTVMNLQKAGRTWDDWMELRKTMPDDMQSRTLVPYFNDDGSVEVSDWSSFIPMGNSTNFSSDAPLEQGPNRDFIAGGPAWNAAKTGWNYAGPGRKVVDPARGQEWLPSSPGRTFDSGAWKLVKGLAPVPTWVMTLPERMMRSTKEQPYRSLGPIEDMDKAMWYSLFPSLEPKTGDELWKTGQAERRGEKGEARGGASWLRRNQKQDAEEKVDTRQHIKDWLNRRKED